MIFFHQRLNNYKRSKLQPWTIISKWPYPTRERHYDALRTKIDMGLTLELISECTLNSSFSANHGDIENDQDNENHTDNKNEGNYPASKYMSKVNDRKKVFGSLYFISSSGSSGFNVDFEKVIVH